MRDIKTLAILCLSLGLVQSWERGDGTKPNIVLFLIDDMGYNDIYYNNAEIISPNMNELATNGLILDKFYAQHMCSLPKAAP